MTEIVQVEFHGGYLHTAMGADGEPVVILKPTIKGMGLDWSAQWTKLQRRSWAVVGQTPTTAADGKTYLMDSCNLDTWSMLLANIDEHRVKPETKQLIIDYQRESARALRNYWTTGSATRPGLPAIEPRRVDPFTVTFDMACAHYNQRTGADLPTTFFTHCLRLAGYLRQGGCVPRRKRRKFFYVIGSTWEVRFWALDLLFAEVNAIIRQFEAAQPFIQPRLDDGLRRPVLPLKRGEVA
jgi:hypothetical protein